MVGVGVTTFGNTLTPSAMAAPAQNGPSPYGPLPAADANGVQLPAGNRLYFSSQRGISGFSSGGITYEVTGPFGT
jgi:hypothetical protein